MTGSFGDENLSSCHFQQAHYANLLILEQGNSRITLCIMICDGIDFAKLFLNNDVGNLVHFRFESGLIMLQHLQIQC